MGVDPALPPPQNLEVLPKHPKVAQTAKTCNLADSGLGRCSTLKIPEKFLLFAIMALNSLVVFLEVLLS